MDESGLTDTALQARLTDMVKPSPALFVCAQLEAELSALEPSESAELLDSYGVQESGLIKLIHAAYDALGLQSYLTAGHKEVRAWTIPRAPPLQRPPVLSMVILSAASLPPTL